MSYNRSRFRYRFRPSLSQSPSRFHHCSSRHQTRRNLSCRGRRHEWPVLSVQSRVGCRWQGPKYATDQPLLQCHKWWLRSLSRPLGRSSSTQWQSNTIHRRQPWILEAASRRWWTFWHWFWLGGPCRLELQSSVLTYFRASSSKLRAYRTSPMSKPLQ